MKITVMNLVAAMGMMVIGASAHADSATCVFESKASGVHLISSSSGELGDTEDGSPVKIAGYLLVARCSGLQRTVFFSKKVDAKRLKASLENLADQSPLEIDFVSISAGMEGRGSVEVPSLNTVNGTVLNLSGRELTERFEIKK